MLEYKKETLDPMPKKEALPSNDPLSPEEEKKKASKDSRNSDSTPPEEMAFLTELLALSTQELMIKEGIVSARAFTLYDGKTLIGFLIRELEDSFILVLPVVMMGDKTGSIITGFLNQQSAMFRLYKNALLSSYVPSVKQLLCYLITAKTRFDALPGYFNTKRVDQIQYMIKVLKAELEPEIGEMKVSMGSLADLKNLGKEEGENSESPERFETDYDKIRELSLKIPKSKYKH